MKEIINKRVHHSQIRAVLLSVIWCLSVCAVPGTWVRRRECVYVCNKIGHKTPNRLNYRIVFMSACLSPHRWSLMLMIVIYAMCLAFVCASRSIYIYVRVSVVPASTATAPSTRRTRRLFIYLRVMSGQLPHTHTFCSYWFPSRRPYIYRILGCSAHTHSQSFVCYCFCCTQRTISQYEIMILINAEPIHKLFENWMGFCGRSVWPIKQRGRRRNDPNTDYLMGIFIVAVGWNWLKQSIQRNWLVVRV